MKMRRPLIILSYITLLLGYLFIFTIGFWTLYPYKPATYKKPDKIENHKVKQGGDLVLIVDFCRYMPVVPVITRSFVDGIVYNIPMTVSPTNDIGCAIRKVLIPVPQSLPAGKYHISTNFKYKVNPIRTIEIVTTSEEFEVIK